MHTRSITAILLLFPLTGMLLAQVPVKKLERPVTLERPVKLVQPAINLADIEMCIDRFPPAGNLPQRDFSLIQPPPRINPDGTVPAVGIQRQPLAGETLKMWNPGQTITVYLNPNNGSEFIREKVRFYARQWEAIANIKFNFVNSFADAQIKVQFSNDKKNWSWIGRDVLSNPLRLYTMHFGSLVDNAKEFAFQRIILHEFGHALGFIHEHQSPANGIQWDKEKVYTYFGGAPNNWTRDEVDQNLFNRYAGSSTNYSRYDSRSIMHYMIDPSLTLNGIGTSSNTEFSPTDIAFARQVYPFPVASGNNSGTLRTGDDCDLVDFIVEYNAVPADKIEFTFELGKMNNINVTWWKQISIPLTNNRKKELWVQNHSLIPAENITWASAQVNFTDLDKSNGIAFWKAKALGVHTLLNYRWYVLSALKGGCRVRLVWKNDTCR